MGTRQAFVGVLWIGMCVTGWAQARKERTDVEETRVKMIALRDASAQSVKDAGFTCLIAAGATTFTAETN